jgi:quinol monooxygenase YgiN
MACTPSRGVTEPGGRRPGDEFSRLGRSACAIGSEAKRSVIMTVIVAGKVFVDPEARDRCIEAHRGIVEAARAYPGCIDVAISPDAVDPGRVNVFEHFESKEALDAWRAIAPRPAASFDFKDVQVVKHVIAASGPPFD